MKLLAPFRKAAALPFVLLLVALNVIVVVALLVYATTELQASKNSGQAEVARALAQSGIDIAAGLIAANSTNNGFVSYQRVTNVGGDWRLETKIGNVVATNPAMPWKTTLVTNPSVLHSGFIAGTDGVDLNFGVGTNTDAGFIAPRVNTGGWTNLSTNMFRMDWIYVYKGDTSKPENLVGRVAYWVDDESSKLNVNYSGTTEVYGTSFDNSQPIRLSIKLPRPGVALSGLVGNLNGRNWPLDTELGGVAGLSITNVKAAIGYRGRPDEGVFRPFPSMLGLRIGTLASAEGPAITTLIQQSALGFTATAYSSEEERSYISGRRRYDLFKLCEKAPLSVITEMQQAISTEYPQFASKYDLEAFAGAAYSLVQLPGASTITSSQEHPATVFGSQRLYTRGLPVVNEINVSVLAGESSGLNTVQLKTSVELILLGDRRRIKDGWNQSGDWGASVAQSTNFMVRVSPLPQATNQPASSFGGWSPPLPINVTNVESWFAKNNSNTNGSGNFGPRSTNFSGALAILSATNSFSTNASLGTWVFPSRFRVELVYNGKAYQDFTFDAAKPPEAEFSASPGQTNVVYALVAQPKKNEGVRGDPRFALFEADVRADTVTGLPGNYTHPLSTPNALNPNWNINVFTVAEKMDLTSDLLFFETDYGIPNRVGDKAYGFGDTMKGIGWLGEVPVINPAGSTTNLAWSTPRFWGDGRENANAPPDWLLMDVFHVGMYKADSSDTFLSRGLVNVNSAKPFFQPITSTINKAVSIIDSVVIGADTRDFTGSGYGVGIDGRQLSRTNVLVQIKSMTESRTSSNNPYTTHFEFLADLAATNLPGNPSWWMAPNTNNPSTNIYTATNTTDRRIEGVVRSLVQKLTTHGNQFSIFSLAQALQVSGSGASAKTNVVGEAYFQAVYERAPQYNETTGAITNGATTGAPPMRQLYLRELRY